MADPTYHPEAMKWAAVRRGPQCRSAGHNSGGGGTVVVDLWWMFSPRLN